MVLPDFDVFSTFYKENTMRKLAIVFALAVTASTAWGSVFVPDMRLTGSPFPVEIYQVEFVPAQNMTLIRGRAINRSGVEQRDVAIGLTFFRNGAPVARTGTDLGHMFDLSYAFFEFHVPGDITSATSFGVVARSSSAGDFYEQPHTIWEGYVPPTPAVCIPCVEVRKDDDVLDFGDPARHLKLSDLHIEHDKDTKAIVSVRGKLTNTSHENLHDRTYFVAVFHDKHNNRLGGINFSLPHLTGGDSDFFTTRLVRGDFKYTDKYDIYITH